MPFSSSPDTCYLFLVRHGATANNVLKPPRLQGRGSDLELSPEGAAQAEQTAEFLAAQSISAVYASPMRRAQETAQAIAARHGLEIRVIEALIECDVGQWEGSSWPEIERDEPEAYRQFQEDPYRFGYLGGENLQQVEDRVTPAFAELMSGNLGRQIVVVAHNVVNRTYLGGLLHVPSARRRLVPQDNCCVNVLRYRNDEIKVLTLNALFHLSSRS